MDTSVERSNVAEQTAEDELLDWVEELQRDNNALRVENSQLTEQAMLLDSMLIEFRQALANAQLSLAEANAKLKISIQATA